jgi:hypothetical protein
MGEDTRIKTAIDIDSHRANNRLLDEGKRLLFTGGISMKKLLILGVAGLVLLALFGGKVIGQQALTVDIVVSPNTINMSSLGQWVTVHADIPYAVVERAELTLNGVPVKWTKSDAQGDLVAKFVLADVVGIIAPPAVMLELSGTTTVGDSFTGTDTVKVIAGNTR